MNNKQQDYLKAMGIEVWQRRHLAAPCQKNPLATDIKTTDWEELRQRVAQCTACGLEKTRTQTVFGVGNVHAKLLIIGEAPGFYEDQQGEPFVGRAGQLLNAMLQAIDLARDSIYITNILKCRPPNNRDPLPEEVKLCTPFLRQQIEWLQPKLILAVGRIAAHFLLNSQAPLKQLRGQIHQYGPQQIPLIVTYHPAYLLRNPQDKGKAYADLLFAQENLCLTLSQTCKPDLVTPR